MQKILTAAYGSGEAARNAHRDLVSVGYPRDKLWLDSDTAEVKVATTLDGEREARELLDRHQPDAITETVR